jgi:glycosyltransferase involved in cell wall biosynthesis
MCLDQKLSIIVPCYNEEKYVTAVLESIATCVLPPGILKEIILINDGSTDGTESAVEGFRLRRSEVDLKIFSHNSNRGKGTCIQTGSKHATGNFIIIQDADLEYNPKDYNKMLPLLIEDRADVVYGSRFRGSEPHRVLFFMHTIGNKFLTFISNLFTQLNLSDMECGYKMFRTEVFQKIHLTERKFGFEPEVTAKISRIKNIRIYEVGISYYGRTYAEGKKIKWQDGFRALYCILKYNLFKGKNSFNKKDYS